MPNIIKNGALYLAQLLKEHASEPVTYGRNGLGTVDVPATFGSKMLRTHDTFGNVRIEWTDLDFIVPAVDLVIAGQQITPAREDYIYVIQGLKVGKYEVFPFGFDPPWRWSDPWKVNYRIHTKMVQEFPSTSPVYFGDSSASTLDDASILGLAGSVLSTTPVGSFPISGTQYRYFAYPEQMGDVGELTLNGATLATAGTTEDSAYHYVTASGITYAIVDIGARRYRVFRSRSPIVGPVDLTVSAAA